MRGCCTEPTILIFEILIVDNQSPEPASCGDSDRLSGDRRTRILSYDAPFNFSAINNFAVAHATGSLLCFLDNNTEVINRDWLTEMVSHAVRPGVGGVGALLYFPDGRIKHAGFALGFGAVVQPVHQGLRLGERGDYGYFGRAAVVQNLSAVTAACLVMQKAVFEEIGGFDERNLPLTYSDVDLCLRIREAGYRIVWTPHAELFHYGSALHDPETETSADRVELLNLETGYMSRRWGQVLGCDPYYNPNLRLDGSGFGLASPPRIALPWRHASAGQRVPVTSSIEARLVAASGLFDPAWYRAQNPDVLAAGIDPLEHYLGNGSKEGRRPNPSSIRRGIANNTLSVAAADVEPLVHYLATGSGARAASKPRVPIQSIVSQELHPDVTGAGMEAAAAHSFSPRTSWNDGGQALAPGRLTNHPDLHTPDFF